MLKHLNIKVTGKVQGVFYRATACDKAIEYNLKGFARNENDGSVYIDAEGEVENLDSFVQWCYIGPPASKVERVITGEGEVQGFTEFKINY